VDERSLAVFEASLERCNSSTAFAERFYELFLARSQKVAQKFASTDFEKQKIAFQRSLDLMLKAARDGREAMEQYLGPLAEQHSSRQLDIGAELYDEWLDSLLAAVREFDPQYNDEIRDAWEEAMMIGIAFMLSRY
jgi:hemoglobin-like flavoprotein